MKYIELFAGIGGFRSALDKLGYECVFSSEIDKYARQSYKALYGHESSGDITKIDVYDIPDHEILVGGFPCQAFSIAGVRKGFEDTRGTLFFEIIRIASAKNPKWLMLENVKGLLSHDGGKTFDVMCACLNDIGYAIDFKVLNSKHYGVPQNRERIFIIANRDAAHEDWTIEGNDVVAKAKKRIAKLGIKTFNFDFPSNNTVDKRLRDVLQDNVQEKYYLSQEKTMKLIAQLNDKVKNDIAAVNPKNDEGGQYYFQDRIFHEKGVMPALTSFVQNVMQEPSLNQIGYIDNNGQGYRVYDTDGLSQTVASVTGGVCKSGGCVAEPKIKVIGTTLDTGAQGTNSRHWVHDVNGLIGTVDATTYKQPKQILEPQVNVIGSLEYYNFDSMNRVHDVEGLSPTIQTLQGGSREPKIAEVYATLTPDREEKRQNGRRFKDNDEEMFTLTAQDIHGIAIKEATKQGYAIAEEGDSVNIVHPNSETRRGRVGKQIANTLEVNCNQGVVQQYRIRKLTPLECWRLQGFTDEQFQRCVDAGVSDSQLYKQAGNAVTVNVIHELGCKLLHFKNKEQAKSDFSEV